MLVGFDLSTIGLCRVKSPTLWPVHKMRWNKAQLTGQTPHHQRWRPRLLYVSHQWMNTQLSTEKPHLYFPSTGPGQIADRPWLFLRIMFLELLILLRRSLEFLQSITLNSRLFETNCKASINSNCEFLCVNLLKGILLKFGVFLHQQFFCCC